MSRFEWYTMKQIGLENLNALVVRVHCGISSLSLPEKIARHDKGDVDGL